MESDWFEQQARGWTESVNSLNGSGWDARLTSVAIPVVIEGRLPDGRAFAFYAKDDLAEFGIGGTDPADVPDWAVTEHHPGASWTSPDEGMPILQRLYQRYVREYPGQDG